MFDCLLRSTAVINPRCPWCSSRLCHSGSFAAAAAERASDCDCAPRRIATAAYAHSALGSQNAIRTANLYGRIFFVVVVVVVVVADIGQKEKDELEQR
jgi:hypothetical protein